MLTRKNPQGLQPPRKGERAYGLGQYPSAQLDGQFVIASPADMQFLRANGVALFQYADGSFWSPVGNNASVFGVPPSYVFGQPSDLVYASLNFHGRPRAIDVWENRIFQLAPRSRYLQTSNGHSIIVAR